MQKIIVILSKCDNVIENIQIHMLRSVTFSFSWGLKICTNVKTKYNNGIFDPFFCEKNWICKKLKIMLERFPIGFCLLTKF